MKFLFRLFIFWLLLGGAFWFWGAPYLMDMLSAKTRTEQAASCIQQLRQQNVVPRPVSEANATHYCECMAEPLQFTLQDALHMQQTKALTPELEAAMKARAPVCQPILDKAMGQPTSPTSRQPKVNEDGSIEIYL